MKLYACCNWRLKFLGPILDAWRANGHEVEYTMGYDPAKHEWADVCLIDVCDHNANVGSTYKFEGSRLVIRAIDIECWVRQPRAVTWENVDALIFGAKHIEELVRSYTDLPESLEVAHVPFGVLPSLWGFRVRNGAGRNMAFVAHQWSAKGLPLLFQVMAKLPGWKLHVLGTENTERWLHWYKRHIIDEMRLDVEFTASVESVDEWLEDKDYLIVSSQKEAFSYVTAEAALKGIKPLVHNFWRAKDIWPESWVWTTIDECIEMIHGPYDSHEYRDFVMQNYTLDHMMEGINRVCRIS